MTHRKLLAASLLLAGLSLPHAASAQGRATILQQGYGHAAGIQQTGSANQAGVVQFGAGNTGVVIQEGNDNAACLVQSGRNLGASVQQTGDYQSTGVFQTRTGLRTIPAETCGNITKRSDAWAYALGRR